MTLPAIGPWAAAGKTPPHVSFVNDPVAGTRYMLEADKKTARADARASKGRSRRSRRKASTDGQLLTRKRRHRWGRKRSAEFRRKARDTLARFLRADRKPEAHRYRDGKMVFAGFADVMMIKRTDPRMGETEFQLTNILRTEPAATLFQCRQVTPWRKAPRHGRARHGWLDRRLRKNKRVAIKFGRPS